MSIARAAWGADPIGSPTGPVTFTANPTTGPAARLRASSAFRAAAQGALVMKYTMIACAALAGAALAGAGHPQTASAAGCAAGPNRAGCAGPRGAAVAGPHGAAAARGGYGYRGYSNRGYSYRGYHGTTGRTCASGPYRAGCAGPHGGAVVRRPY
jgi:hypothetical protein